MDGRTLIRAISVIFSVTMGLLVVLGSLVMMYGNFDLGVILFVLGLVMVISNESILPRLRRSNDGPRDSSLVEEVANLAAIGYTPPVLLGVYLYLTGQHDFKLIIFMAVSFIVVSMKIFSKAAASRFAYRPLVGEQVYVYRSSANEDYSEPGV